MAYDKLISGVHAVGHWGRGTVLRLLRWPGTRSWKREATILMSILLTLTVGYLTAFRYASYTVQDLVGTCTARLEIELEGSDMAPSKARCLGPCANAWLRRFSTRTVLFAWPWSTGTGLIRCPLNR